MDGLDGILLIPPDRGQILGRAVWKPRYIVLSRPSTSPRDNHQSNFPAQVSRIASTGSRSLSKPQTDEYTLSIFKSKEDVEPAFQWPVSSVADCQVQMLAHRKQGPVLPTLVLKFSDKERKRRSSRAAGLISHKDSGTVTMWFRTPPDNNYPSLHDWARSIIAKKGLMTPDSPVSPNLSNPFTRRETSDSNTRPGSGNASTRTDGRQLLHKSSTATYSTGARERPITFASESPSLKSKRSDISSPSSSTYPIQQFGYSSNGQNFLNTLPSDLPSPTTTVGDYQGEFIEGWTSAQGRSSTVSSPVHGRDSISSQALPMSMGDSSSPPGPRETILDRAFQMKFIPGSDRDVPGEEKLTSLARFEALMRDTDSKRKQQHAVKEAENLAIRSAFDADDSTDEGDAQEAEDTDTDDDNFIHEQDEPQSPSLIPPAAQRALDFISSRHETVLSPTSPRPFVSRAHLSFHADSASHRLPIPPSRPHTAHGRARPGHGQRSQTTPQLSSVPMLDSAPPGKLAEETTLRPRTEKRQSSASSKRLSFTEFTKRLSSTSSLLLVQTNNSGGSSRPNSEVDIGSTIPRTHLIPRGAGGPPKDRDDQGRRCGWRNSVGVLGTEGGFL